MPMIVLRKMCLVEHPPRTRTRTRIQMILIVENQRFILVILANIVESRCRVVCCLQRPSFRNESKEKSG